MTHVPASIANSDKERSFTDFIALQHVKNGALPIPNVTHMGINVVSGFAVDAAQLQ